MTGPAGTRGDRPLVLLGPTASGKSALALEIAGLIDGVELVSIDSMQVYRGMDIGTATPSDEERRRVRHHLVDLVEPSVDFTVGEFQRRAREALDDIRARGGVPLLVGGTGLYLRAVIDDLDIPGQFPEARAEVEREPHTETLHARLAELDAPAANRIEPSNRRRVVRALEVTLGSGRAFSSYGPGLETYGPTPYVQIGVRWDRAELDARIEARYHRQVEEGFVDEVRRFLDAGPSRSAAQALGYKELSAHLRGDCSLDDALTAAIARTRRFARRQERWFRRDPRIRWIDAPVAAGELIAIWDEVRAMPV